MKRKLAEGCVVGVGTWGGGPEACLTQGAGRVEWWVWEYGVWQFAWLVGVANRSHSTDAMSKNSGFEFKSVLL